MRKLLLTILLLFLTGCSNQENFGVSNLSNEKILDKYNKSTQIKEKYSVNGSKLVKSDIKNSELDKYSNEPKDEIKITVGGNIDNFLGATESVFQPDIKIERWNETSFSLNTEDLLNEVSDKDKNIYFDDNRILFESPSMSFEMFDIEDGYKYIWYLNEKPLSNIVKFKINSNGLDFFYQPSLKEEYKDGYNEEFKREIIVSDTEVVDKDGNILVSRPENIIGSYAVYNSTKGGLVDKDGKDYGSGKAFHIYRPHIIDAKGNETWGKLNIDIKSSSYTVEIPQEFLDKATYPVKSNDTFGYTSVGETQNTSLAINTIRTWVYAPSSAGTITAINFYTAAKAGYTYYLRGVVYLDSDKSRVTFGSEVQNTWTSFFWKELSVTSASISTVNYRIGIWVNSNGSTGPLYAYDAGATMYRDNETYSSSNNPPSTLYDNDTFADRKASVYATYTSSSTSIIYNQASDIIVFEE